MVCLYVESKRSHIISNSIIFSLYLGLNWVLSDPEADDIPMCHITFWHSGFGARTQGIKTFQMFT